MSWFSDIKEKVGITDDPAEQAQKEQEKAWQEASKRRWERANERKKALEEMSGVKDYREKTGGMIGGIDTAVTQTTEWLEEKTQGTMVGRWLTGKAKDKVESTAEKAAQRGLDKVTDKVVEQAAKRGLEKEVL